MMWNGLTFNFESTMQAHNSGVRTMQWSHNEQWLVTGDDEGKIRYFQTSMNKVMEFGAHYRDDDPDGLPQLAPVREVHLCLVSPTSPPPAAPHTKAPHALTTDA